MYSCIVFSLCIVVCTVNIKGRATKAKAVLKYSLRILYSLHKNLVLLYVPNASDFAFKIWNNEPMVHQNQTFQLLLSSSPIFELIHMILFHHLQQVVVQSFSCCSSFFTKKQINWFHKVKFYLHSNFQDKYDKVLHSKAKVIKNEVLNVF